MATIKIKTHCPFCKQDFEHEYDADGIQKWRSGMSIQSALPNSSADDREALISGICPECWDKTFPKEED